MRRKRLCSSHEVGEVLRRKRKSVASRGFMRETLRSFYVRASHDEPACNSEVDSEVRDQ